MARVNLERRAEIGLAKRTRTRAVILQAARTCYAAETAAPVTVDSVMQAAGLAKGTFYVHFQDLTALEAELAGALIEELDESLQPARLAADHPLTRLATGVTILLRDLASAPARARLVGRVVSAVPGVGGAVQAHLREDLAEVSSAGLLAMRSVDLSAGVVTALCELAARELGERAHRRESDSRHRARHPARHGLRTARSGRASRSGGAPCRCLFAPRGRAGRRAFLRRRPMTINFAQASPGGYRFWTVMAAATLILVAASVAGCSKKVARTPDPRPVRTVTVETRADGETVSFTGQIRAKDQVNLAFRLDGRMIERNA